MRPISFRPLMAGTLAAWAALGLWNGPAPRMAHAAAYVVNTGDDTDDGVCDGAHCSLREAILAANASAGPDSISFSIGGGGLQTIAPNSSGLGALPTITDAVVVDGTTQPGWAGTPIIELDGSLAPTGSTGLHFEDAGPGNVVMGFVVNRFGTGIHAARNSTLFQMGLTIDGNYVGVDPTGSIGLGMTFGVGLWDGAEATIGGPLGNVISGNTYGVYNRASYPSTWAGFITVKNNKIGTNAAGTAAIPNEAGIYLFDGYFGMFGGPSPTDRNVISGNTSYGVVYYRTAFSASYSITIQGNYIGTDVTGSYAIGNGVGIDAQARGNGASAINNVISGNATGVSMSNLATLNLTANYIGTDVSGTTAVPNTVQGVSVNGGVDYLSISRNVISGNGGAGLVASGAGFGEVSDNLIGTDASGAAPLGNTGVGIALSGYNYSVTGNTIANNASHGVTVTTGLGNRIQANSIYSNAGLGIENTSGGNTELPPPVVASVTATDVSGTACANCAIDVFSDAADEGRWYHGQTSADGTGSWSIPMAIFGNATATATDASNNTSEFSAPVAAPPGTDADADGVADSGDNCIGLANAQQENNDRNFIDQTPPSTQDDRTVVVSDGLGDACDGDDDNDGLTDTDELSGAACAGTSTDPIDADWDNDRVLDGAECSLGTNPRSGGSKPTQAQCGSATDADGDRLSERVERCGYNSDPNDADTDDDLDGSPSPGPTKDGCEAASLNNDRVVNAGDQLLMVIEILAQPSPSLRLGSFDINKDGAVNAGDQLLLAQLIAPGGQCP